MNLAPNSRPVPRSTDCGIAATSRRILLVMISLPATTALAQQNMWWRSSGGGTFQDVENWSAYQGHSSPATGTPENPLEPGLPATTYRAVFELVSNGTVIFTGSATTADAQVLRGGATFALGGHTWDTGSTFSILAPFVNPDGNGPESPPYTGVTASATVSGGILNTTSLLVGAGDIRNAGTLTLSAATLNSANLQIAQSGTGTLNLTNGSLLNTTPASSSAVAIGGQLGSNATVNISGNSIWNIGPNGVLQVGGFGGTGSGTLNITSGVASGRELHVAINYGINGAVYVNGGSSQLTMSDGIHIGQGGLGTMHVTNGGIVSSAPGSSSSVGNSGGGSGVVAISGAGSSWTTGALTLNSAGTAINVSGDGLLNVRGPLMVQYNARLDIEATGNLEAASLLVNQNGAAYLDGTVATDVITVEGAGSVVYQTGDNVTIDNGAGLGILQINSGGVYHGAPRIGLGTGAASGLVSINGSGSLWDIGSSYIFGAGGGLGSVTLSSGGAVTSGDLMIGLDSNGVVEIQHTGSQWSGSAAYVGGSATESADAGITGRLTIYPGGLANIAGPLKVWGGGRVQVFGGNLDAGSIHIAGGIFDNSGSVSSTGSLTVTGGGSYSTDSLTIGGLGFGGSNVSGMGSFIDANDVVVYSGATLAIGSGASLGTSHITLDGGQLQNSGSILSNGSLTITGGGTFNATGPLEIGGTGFESVSISDPGSEILVNTINVRSMGMLTVDSGGNVTGSVNALGGTSNGGFGGSVLFENLASAGVLTLVIASGTASGAAGGIARFNDSATAGIGSITIHGSGLSDAGAAVLQFNHQTSAESASITIDGGTISGADGGGVEFNHDAGGGDSNFTITGGAISGADGGGVAFNDSSSAGNSNFTVNGGAVSGAAGGGVAFNGGSTAADSTITVRAGGETGARSAVVEFLENASAGNSIITNSGSDFTGSLTDGTAGGMTWFGDFSHAGDATLVAQGGTNGGLGGSIVFSGQSSGDDARVQLYGNGRLDVSLHQGNETSVGSIEGTGDIFLGSRELVIGTNDMSTVFAGSLQDDGLVFDFSGIHEFGGALIKEGDGVTTLTGVNTYTGITGVGEGTLIADLSLHASVLNAASALHVSNGTFELRGLVGAARVQVLNGLTLRGGAGTIAVDNPGISTTLDLSVSGIARPEGGTVDFRATTGTLGVDAIIKTAHANSDSGIIGAWATVNGGAALAANNGSNVIVAYTAYTDISSNGSIGNDPTANVRVTSGSGGVVTLGAATTAISTLTQNNTSAAIVDMAGETLIADGILLTPTAADLTIGGTAGSGFLTADGELILVNRSPGALTINANVTGDIAMTISGTTILNGTNSHTGATNVESGMLVVNGGIGPSIGVNLAAGTMLSGHGSVSAIGGQGTVAPGNSPGIMTATTVDPGDDLKFEFQFTQLGAPAFLNPGASGNDLLRLGGLLPFTSELNSYNDITLDFTGFTSALSHGDFLLGGFYADHGGDFLDQIRNANFEFLGLGPNQDVSVTTVQHTANFGSGDVNGYITRFTLGGIECKLTPATSSSAATTPFVLEIIGLEIGETVLVERFVDQDGDESIGEGELLVEASVIIDGHVPSIGGVPNTNIPCDHDGAADGRILLDLTPATGPELGRLAGNQIIRISSPFGTFAAFTRTLAITHPAQAQSVSGIVTDGNDPVPFASVVLLDAANDDEFAVGSVADAAGQFTLNAPVGSYVMQAFKNGYVTNYNTVIELEPGTALPQDVQISAASSFISGRVADEDSNAGLGGVQLLMVSASGLAAIASSNVDGTYSVPVTAGTWHAQASDISLSRLGYLGLSGESDATADTTGGAASGADINLSKVTALIHGMVADAGANPLAGIRMHGTNNNPSGYSVATTAANGHYVLGVAAGSWNVGISEGNPGLAGYVIPDNQSVTIADAQAQQADFLMMLKPSASDNWRMLYFGDSSNSGIGADSATPDDDGISNLIKYGLVITPGSSGAHSLPAAQTRTYSNEKSLALVFTRDPARNDITLCVQGANSPMGPWGALATSANGAAFAGAGFVSEIDSDNGYLTVEIRDTVRMEDSTHRFMRVTVTR